MLVAEIQNADGVENYASLMGNDLYASLPGRTGQSNSLTSFTGSAIMQQAKSTGRAPSHGGRGGNVVRADQRRPAALVLPWVKLDTV